MNNQIFLKMNADVKILPTNRRRKEFLRKGVEQIGNVRKTVPFPVSKGCTELIVARTKKKAK